MTRATIKFLIVALADEKFYFSLFLYRNNTNKKLTIFLLKSSKKYFVGEIGKHKRLKKWR